MAMNDFEQLISTIDGIHNELQNFAVKTVNQSLTVRNWLIGYYIVEYEQKGLDRAQYGEKIIEELAQNLKHIKGIDRRSLFKFRLFYLAYTNLFSPVHSFVSQNLQPKVGTVLPLLKDLHLSLSEKPIEKVGTLSPQFGQDIAMPADVLLSKLSYSHFELLLKIDKPLKRTFYELECIKGTWSIRELKRQLNSQYFERSALSKSPKAILELTLQKTFPQKSTDIVKNLYAFEFLELGIKNIVEESDFETALLDNLQQFILELGHGFCFEARQKRILIGENYYFIDLVFYHRILKCHVLIELKIGEFEHGNIGQLNTYLNYYKKNECLKSDNPPVGILMVAEKDQALVEYAKAGMDENLFVKEYLLQLPDTELLKNHIEKEIKSYRN